MSTTTTTTNQKRKGEGKEEKTQSNEKKTKYIDLTLTETETEPVDMHACRACGFKGTYMFRCDTCHACVCSRACLCLCVNIPMFHSGKYKMYPNSKLPLCSVGGEYPHPPGARRQFPTCSACKEKALPMAKCTGCGVYVCSSFCPCICTRIRKSRKLSWFMLVNSVEATMKCALRKDTDVVIRCRYGDNCAYSATVLEVAKHRVDKHSRCLEPNCGHVFKDFKDMKFHECKRYECPYVSICKFVGTRSELQVHRKTHTLRQYEYYMSSFKKLMEVNIQLLQEARDEIKQLENEKPNNLLNDMTPFCS